MFEYVAVVDPEVFVDLKLKVWLVFANSNCGAFNLITSACTFAVLPDKGTELELNTNVPVDVLKLHLLILNVRLRSGSAIGMPWFCASYITPTLGCFVILLSVPVAKFPSTAVHNWYSSLWEVTVNAYSSGGR